MKTITNILILVVVFAVMGCFEQQRDSRVNLREGVGSATLGKNAVTRAVGGAFSALLGEGIDLKQAIMKRNDAGLLELHVNGYNRSQDTKRFRYRVEWLDESGLFLQSKTSVWLRMSVMGKSPFGFKVVSPTPKATNFRMDTRKWE